MDNLGLCDPLGHINQPPHLRVCLLQTFMGSSLKFLQCMEFFSLHTVVIGAKFLKEFGDMVKSGKNSCFNSQHAAITLRRRRICISPYDNG